MTPSQPGILPHPSQVHIFKLWQIYLERVNPLLKVTHTPSLQPRIIDAAGDVTNVTPSLEALLLSIYCVAIISLAEGECVAMFQTSKDSLLSTYHPACQQALLRCGAWWSGSGSRSVEDQDFGLVALYLYLVRRRI